MKDSRLVLSSLPQRLAVCSVPKNEEVPGWAFSDSAFVSVTRTYDEISVVCDEASVPDGVKAERGWRAFEVEGPLDFSMTGIISSLTAPLAEKRISVFAISTYMTDYVLVKSENFEEAGEILSQFFELKS